VGYAPLAPGTAGSAVAMAAYLVAVSVGLRFDGWEWGALILLLYALGVFSAGAMEREWGEDPGPVVIDEVLGYVVTVAWLPSPLAVAVSGFVLFRALDILKPPPARQSERLPGGWGIMTDDLVAGVYSNLLVRAGIVAAAWWTGG